MGAHSIATQKRKTTDRLFTNKLDTRLHEKNTRGNTHTFPDIR